MDRLLGLAWVDVREGLAGLCCVCERQGVPPPIHAHTTCTVAAWARVATLSHVCALLLCVRVLYGPASFVGIAKRANLIAVRVLDCTGSGSTAGVIRGINWAASRTGSVRVAP